MQTINTNEEKKSYYPPKYGIVFIVFLIIAKIIYLGIEVYYNGSLIDAVSSSAFTQSTLEELESLGHNISSVGFTLLVIPIFYLIYIKYDNILRLFAPFFAVSILVVLVYFRYLHFLGFAIISTMGVILYYSYKKFMITTMMIFTSIVLYLFFHFMLSLSIDKIVENNQDKRYSSYYISALKNGMLNDSLGYELFMPREHLKNLSVKDKVILSNIFLLNYIDEKLIDKIVKKGKNQLLDVFILQLGYEKYSKKESGKRIPREIDLAYVYENIYKEFKGSLKYKKTLFYRRVDRFKQSTNLSSRKRDQMYRDLRKYFKYQGYAKAQRQYKQKMNREFGHYIKPSRWCQGGYCPSKSAISRVVRQEGAKKFRKNSKGISPYLKKKDFFNNKKVKAKIVDRLRAKGINVPKNFNYSKSQYIKAYKKMIAKKFLLSKKEFNMGENAELGDNAIKNLYIPPFAISMSLIAGILNFVSLIGMLLFLVIKIDKHSNTVQFFIKSSVKVFLLVLLIAVPYTQMDKASILKTYPALKKVKESETGAEYLNLLEWIMVYEKFGYENLYKYLRPAQ